MCKFNINHSIFLLLIVLLFTSCLSSKRISNFNQLGNSGEIFIKEAQRDFEISKGDLIKVNVMNVDLPTLNEFSNFNLNGGLVKENGYLHIPLIGELKVENLTEPELRKVVYDSLVSKGIAIKPSVEVLVVNKGVSIFGEINKPGRISFQGNGIALTEALALAGNLSDYANRKNVLLMRKEEGKIKYFRFNMNDSTAFSQDVFYLRNNDIIYIEPNGTKVFVTSQSRAIVGFITGILSLYLITLNLR